MQMHRAQYSNANQNEMTQIERNFGTKALRRDGVRCDTQGGRALYLAASVGCAKACEAASCLIYYLLTYLLLLVLPHCHHLLLHENVLQRTDKTIQQGDASVQLYSRYAATPDALASAHCMNRLPEQSGKSAGKLVGDRVSMTGYQ
jgi:hypothetical protein